MKQSENSIRAKEKQWETAYKKSSEIKDVFRNQSGIELKPLYTPADVIPERFLEELGFPGDFPMTRGIYPGMYRTRGWTRRMLIGFESPETFNRRQKEMLASGTTAVNLIPCNSVFRGYDSDMVEKELVGLCGVPINCLQDMALTLEDLPLDQLSFGLNDPGPFTLAAMLFVLAERQGISVCRLTGTSNQSDFISHFVANHMFYRFSLEGHLRVLLDHIKYCSRHAALWNPLSIVGQHMQQAGATPVQALAFTLASGIFYADACVKAGIDIDSFAHRFTFFFDVSINVAEEAAKFRAGRRMWAKIMRDRFGAKDPRSWRFKFHAQTSGAELTRVQVENNVVRVVLQALGAILGGCQSLHTDAYDEALSVPSEESARLAIMTQNIIAEESGLADVIDPLGGSYYIETLTDEMEARAWDYINKIDALGGMLEAVRSGYIQREIGLSAEEAQRAVSSGQRTVVGVNKYVKDSEEAVIRPIAKPDPIEVERQIRRVVTLKQTRKQSAARQALDDLRRAADSPDGNTFAAVIDALKQDVTHGEIVSVLREELGFGQPLIDVV